MKFKVMTDEEIEKARMNFIPGPTKFKIIGAQQKQSKSGNDMIELKLHCTDIDNNTLTVFDYIVNKDSMLWKLKHFCENTGMPQKYEDGDLTAMDCHAREGICETYLQKGKNGYSDKISVKDYCDADVTMQGKVKKEKKEEFSDDDIPF